ncbi:glycosyltransferase family 4 protein [Pseudomonadota bacterium]|jgi:glycosyltransferase involved in cell wall biosynthesis|nr:glycosyltransferase family 4 protein [Pseudomonadota bacterium]
MKYKVLAFALYGPNAASHRYRLLYFKEVLQQYDIEVTINSLLNDQYLKEKFSNKRISYLNVLRCYWRRIKILRKSNDYDLVIVHLELFKLFPAWLERQLIKNKFIYDFDDAFFLKYKSHRNIFVNYLFRFKLEKMMTNSALNLAGNNYLLSYAKKYNKNSILWPTVLPLYKYQRPRIASKPSTQGYTIGWIGSPSTSIYLDIVKGPLAAIGMITKIKLLVVGGKAPVIPNIEIIEKDWNYDTYIDDINACDIGIMPLFNSDWERGKCAFKLLQYMALSKPVVASNVGANRDVVTSKAGFLVDTEQDWIEALLKLIESPKLMDEMGANGREVIENNYSVESKALELKKIIKELV